MKFKQSLIFFLIAGIFFCFLFPILMNLIPVDQNRYLSNLKKEFRGVVKRNESDFGGARMITFENGTRFSVDPYYKSDTIKNEQLELKKWDQNMLNMFLQPGDSLFKIKNSDTIFVYRNNIEYTFIDRHSSSGNVSD